MANLSLQTQESAEERDGGTPAQLEATSTDQPSDDPSYVTQKTGSSAHQANASNQAAQDSGETESEDPMLQDAVKEMRRIHHGYDIDEKKRQARLYVVLARVFRLSMAGMRDQPRHQELLRRTQIKVREDTPHHKQTLRAVMAEAGWKPPKGTEHEWTQVLTAFQLDEVPETEPAVTKWLTENAKVSGVVVSGFARAEAVVKHSTKLKVQRRAKKQERDANDADALEALTRTAELQKLGTIEVTEEAEVPDGLGLSFNRGTSVLAPLQIKPEELRRLVLKHGPSSHHGEEPRASKLTKEKLNVRRSDVLSMSTAQHPIKQAAPNAHHQHHDLESTVPPGA